MKLIGFFQDEYTFNWFSEEFTYFQCQRRRRKKVILFDGDNSLSTHTNSFCKLLLCDIDFGSFYLNSILHQT